MKKFTTYAIVSLIILAIAGSVVMAAPGSPRGPWAGGPQGQPINLTDAQKADLAKIQYQMLDLRKQMMQVYVDAGVITQEVADARITLMKANLDNAVKNGTVGYGMGFGGRGCGGFGGGRGPGFGPGWQGQPPANQ